MGWSCEEGWTLDKFAIGCRLWRGRWCGGLKLRDRPAEFKLHQGRNIGKKGGSYTDIKSLFSYKTSSCVQLRYICGRELMPCPGNSSTALRRRWSWGIYFILCSWRESRGNRTYSMLTRSRHPLCRRVHSSLISPVVAGTFPFARTSRVEIKKIISKFHLQSAT